MDANEREFSVLRLLRVAGKGSCKIQVKNVFSAFRIFSGELESNVAS